MPLAVEALQELDMHRRVQLVVSGGIRTGADVAKALALGADAVSIGVAALIALGDNSPALDAEYAAIDSACRSPARAGCLGSPRRLADPVMRYACIMKRTTVMMPDDVLVRLRHESRRRGTSVAEIVREAVEHHLPGPRGGEPLAFFAAGEGGPADASEHVDVHVAASLRKRSRHRG